MQWAELVQSLRSAQGYDEDSEIYVKFPNADEAYLVQSVGVEQFGGKTLMIIVPNDNEDEILYETDAAAEPGDNAAASELDTNVGTGDPAIQSSTPSQNPDAVNSGDEGTGEPV